MFLVFTLLMLGALWVTYRWAVDSFAWCAKRRRALAVAIAMGIVVQAALGWLLVELHSRVAGSIHVASITLLMAIELAAVPLVLFRVLIWAIARAQPGPSVEAGPPLTTVTRRQLIEGAGGGVIFGATGSMLAWGMVRGRHAFELSEVPVRIAGLPRALDGYVIAHISDIHTGVHVGERELDEGLALVRRARPDLVVVTGDLVDLDPAFAPLVARKLGELAARDGVAAVLGNHDYYAGSDRVVAALRATGVDVLVDQGRVVRPRDGGGFALLGVDDVTSARHGRAGPRLEHALATVSSELPRILLSHQPQTVDRWAGKVALQLSGHTHGGQINPGFRVADLFFPYIAGSYSVRETTLYVNRGFGTVGPPLRVGAPPEVTRIVLVAG